MNTKIPQIGLVLTGGGAKGAYQAGALQYIAEIGLKPQIIAGTSIGALNGATLASNTPFTYAVQRLNDIWTKLGQTEIIHLSHNPTGITLNQIAKAFIPTFRHWLINFSLQMGISNDKKALFDPEPMEQMLKETVNPTALRNGIELWVTVFPSLKIPGLDYDWLLDIVRAKMGTKAQWLCVQDCTDDETLYNLLLASAAIPFAFPQREINGKYYVDGGLADNVPLAALAARGCSHAIVIHLSNGTIWSRHDFPEQTVIEIRPQEQINKSEIPLIGLADTYLDFSPERIADLKCRGYADARRCLEPILNTLVTVRQQRQIENSLLDSTQMLLDDAPL
ncbi:MAG: patatin-like phospholipase family protein [Xenococcus sp. (in: cyanobacteria)]